MLTTPAFPLPTRPVLLTNSYSSFKPQLQHFPSEALPTSPLNHLTHHCATTMAFLQNSVFCSRIHSTNVSQEPTTCHTSSYAITNTCELSLGPLHCTTDLRPAAENLIGSSSTEPTHKRRRAPERQTHNRWPGGERRITGIQTGSRIKTTQS